MQQIYGRTPMRKCDFNKAALQLFWNHTSAGVFSCKFAAYFQKTFSKEHLWVTASVVFRFSQFILLQPTEQTEASFIFYATKKTDELWKTNVKIRRFSIAYCKRS